MYINIYFNFIFFMYPCSKTFLFYVVVVCVFLHASVEFREFKKQHEQTLLKRTLCLDIATHILSCYSLPNDTIQRYIHKVFQLCCSSVCLLNTQHSFIYHFIFNVSLLLLFLFVDDIFIIIIIIIIRSCGVSILSYISRFLLHSYLYLIDIEEYKQNVIYLRE